MHNRKSASTSNLFLCLVFNIHIALNPASQSQVVANGISFFITNLETVGYVLHMEAQKWMLTESFGCFSLKDAKEIQFVGSAVISINSSPTRRGN